jgi:hypothetical protein
MCGTIRGTLRHNTLQRAQLKFYKIMAEPMLTYTSKNWTIIRSDKNKIESAEIKFLLSVAGYILLDQNRSTDIRSELKIFSSTERIERQKENCHGHILRMTTNRFPKVLLNYKPRYLNIGRSMPR